MNNMDLKEIVEDQLSICKEIGAKTSTIILHYDDFDLKIEVKRKNLK